MTTTTHRGGFVGFLTTIPGIITACAGLITAMAGLYQLSQPPNTSSTNETGSSQAPIIVNMPPETAPDEAVSANEVDVTSLPEVSVSDPVQQLVSDCGAGYVDACASLLDMLVGGCYDGLGDHCDALYWASPVGSDYEAYGATCGGRVSADYAGTCGQL